MKPLALNDRRWNEELATIIRSHILGFAQQGLNEADDMTTNVHKALDEEFLSMLDDYSLKLSTEINGESETLLQEVIANGVLEGKPPADIADDIRSMLSFNEDIRADMIARTESTRFRMRGVLYRWAESGIVEYKRWNAAGDACPECQALDGTVVGLSDAFTSNAYEDVIAPPLHPNCRCALIGEVVEEEVEAET